MRSYPTLEALLQVKKEFTRSVELEDVPYYKASQENAWFTKPQIHHRIQCINDGLLQESTMKTFLASCEDSTQSKIIALIPSGNIPLSFASDLICILLAGHNALVKPSSKDSVLTAYFIELINRHLPNRVLLTSNQISDFDASIATGSDQAQPYFTQYFGKKPHVFRRNRRSIGILRGDENTTDFEKLAEDILRYHGMGCRNIHHLIVPKEFVLDPIFEACSNLYPELSEHLWKENHQYRYTISLMNKEVSFSDGWLTLREADDLNPPLTCVNVTRWTTEDDINGFLEQHKNSLQTVVSKKLGNLGQAQNPSLLEYADGVDLAEFLSSL
ncbi:MAG: hypothetical protein ACPGYF_05670 [Chitinophagales bacterium]